MKHTTNTLSTLYRSIDQTKISDKAKETLKKLRLATGNFVGKDEEAKQLFVDFFNKLKESKPIAVKTTPEYKKALRDAQRERGKALGEKRKKESQDKKGTGNDIDASRPAKPYGWRMRGKHNYKKPTRADITEGRAYYEGRVNRADVKRKKYPMLKKGGMAEGNEIKEGDLVMHKKYGWIMRVDKIEDGKYYLENDKRGMEISGKAGNNGSYGKSDIKKYEDGGYMAEGGMINHGFRSGDKIIEIYKGYGIIESKDVVEVINPSQGSRYVVDHGNTMDEQIDGAKRMIDNMTPIELVDRIEIGTDRNGSMDRRGVEYAKGGILKEDDFVWNSLGKKLIVDKVTKDEYYLVGFGQPSASPFLKSKVDNYIKNGEWTLKPKQYAKGGEVFYTEKHKND